MWYKEENDQLVAPPINYTTPDGRTICNFNLSESFMTEFGWRDWTDAEIEAWHQAYPDPEPPPQTVFTKLQIRRAMRSLNIENKLDTLLEASDIFRKDWTDAQEIDLADPVLIEALATGGITDEEIAAIRNAIVNA